MTKQEFLDSLPRNEEGEFDQWNYSNSYGGIARDLFPNVRWFFDKQEGSYQGDWYMLGRDGDMFYFFAMGYGSCSGCDWLQSIDTIEEMGELCDRILATKTFQKNEILDYVKRFDWQNSYDRDENNPLVKEVVEAVEKELLK